MTSRHLMNNSQKKIGRSLFIMKPSRTLLMLQISYSQPREIITDILHKQHRSRIPEKIEILGNPPRTQCIMVLKVPPIKASKFGKSFR